MVDGRDPGLVRTWRRRRPPSSPISSLLGARHLAVGLSAARPPASRRDRSGSCRGRAGGRARLRSPSRPRPARAARRTRRATSGERLPRLPAARADEAAGGRESGCKSRRRAARRGSTSRRRPTRARSPRARPSAPSIAAITLPAARSGCGVPGGVCSSCVWYISGGEISISTVAWPMCAANERSRPASSQTTA